MVMNYSLLKVFLILLHLSSFNSFGNISYRLILLTRLENFPSKARGIHTQGSAIMLILWSRIRLLVYIRNFAKKNKQKKIGDCHVIAALVVQRPDILTIPHTLNTVYFLSFREKEPDPLHLGDQPRVYRGVGGRPVPRGPDIAGVRPGYATRQFVFRSR